MKLRIFLLAVVLPLLTVFVQPMVLAQSQGAPVWDPDNPFVNAEDNGSTEYINLPGADANAGLDGDALINVIKGVINWILGILAFIVLLIVLYAGFLMLFSLGNEENFNKGWKVLKYAIIGLLIIGLARFIVSIIFWLIGLVTVG